MLKFSAFMLVADVVVWFLFYSDPSVKVNFFYLTP